MTRSDAYTHAIDLSFGERSPRVAVGLLWQETNSFNPLPTRRDDFIVHEGNDLVVAYEDSETSLGGIIRRLRTLGARPVPVLAAKARPGGRIEAEVIDDLISRLVAGIVATAPDAVCLELHGSMGAENMADVEGELLSRLRRAVGNHVPVTVALDLHGNMTTLMAASADFLTAYRTHPHADMAETGARAASVLAAVMLKGVTPVASMRSLPFLALFNDETSLPPMLSTRKLAQDMLAQDSGAFLDLSIFNVHPFLDLANVGQVVLAYADGEDGSAKRVADAVAGHLWDIRTEFVLHQPGLEELFEHVGQNRDTGGRPVALGDQGDSVLAGTPGDSMEIARFGIANHPDFRGFIPVYDPRLVALARKHGVGACFTASIGATVSPMLAPLSLDVEVERLTDGRFTNTGAYMMGLPNDLGDSAVLRCGALVLIATTKAPSACDPGFVEHAGYAVADFDYLVLKAGNHFRLSFEVLCDCFTAPTNGLSGREITSLPHRLARPIFPIDEFAECSRA